MDSRKINTKNCCGAMVEGNMIQFEITNSGNDNTPLIIKGLTTHKLGFTHFFYLKKKIKLRKL